MRFKRPRALTGKVAFVTGGARGVGLATAHALRRAGVALALADLDGPLARQAACEVGSGTVALELDVTDTDAYRAALDEAESRLGPIDILINNAGIMPIGHFEEESDELARKIFEVNLHAVLWSSKEAVRRWRATNRGGHIINVASGVGWVAAGGGASYSGSKFAVVGFSHALSLELHGTGIDISVVGPSIIKTELSAGLDDLKGLGAVTPEQVADGIVDGLRYPRFAIWVPRAMGVMALTLSAIPYPLRDALARAQNVDKLLLTADPGRRAAYEARVRQPTNGEPASTDAAPVSTTSASSLQV
jgi:NAD(P)-dependent dehydrogenase (short-subunit alcohol dehydrogenase family)